MVIEGRDSIIKPPKGTDQSPDAILFDGNSLRLSATPTSTWEKEQQLMWVAYWQKCLGVEDLPFDIPVPRLSDSLLQREFTGYQDEQSPTIGDLLKASDPKLGLLYLPESIVKNFSKQQKLGLVLSNYQNDQEALLHSAWGWMIATSGSPYSYRGENEISQRHFLQKDRFLPARWIDVRVMIDFFGPEYFVGRGSARVLGSKSAVGNSYLAVSVIADSFQSKIITRQPAYLDRGEDLGAWGVMPLP